ARDRDGRGHAMKGLLSALLLGSGCLAGAAGAQEIEWHAVRPGAPASLGSCVTVGEPRPLPVTRTVYRPSDGPRVIRASAESLEPDPPARAPVAWGAFTTAAAPVPAGATAPPAEPALLPDDLFALDLPRFYARADYLMWWFKGERLPPLVTTGPNLPSGLNGFLGTPGTVVLFGGSDESGGLRSGARLTAGVWCDDEGDAAVEASGFFLGQRSFRFSANSNQFPVLARPFFNLNAMTEFAQEATAPGLSSGSVSVGGPGSLWGAEIDLRCCVCQTCYGRLDFLVGPRYLQLDEGLQIHESLLGLAGAGPFAGSHIDVVDRFDTRNQFFGAQAGLDYRLTRGPWSLDLLGKLALGDSHEVVNIAGGQRIVSPSGAVSTFNGGLLALPSNSGEFTRDRFAVVPEVGVTLGWQATDWCRLLVGYNFLYWSSVARPGDQIDRVIDVTQIPNFGANATPTGMARPAAIVRGTDFWAQGATFGVEFRY
ncbi:MAG TPA: BBP7 family outer membrane beta-barrel protein, partial [Gemmataceae bacterium]|nr:BBP7 family outer membrane beta-barrel protein [Gemmataceae bacterium]